MQVTALLMTHAIAREMRKAPFFFSPFTFDRMRERKNTHFCFHCGGQWGFRPNEDKTITNHEDTKATLFQSLRKKHITVAEALKNPVLCNLIVDEPGYPRRKKGDQDYNDWLGYSAHLVFCSRLVTFAEKNGCEISRHNPMEKHDPITHASGVVGEADKYTDVYNWLSHVITKNFPYVVQIT